jgi:hypothetical protein
MTHNAGSLLLEKWKDMLEQMLFDFQIKPVRIVRRIRCQRAVFERVLIYI